MDEKTGLIKLLCDKSALPTAMGHSHCRLCSQKWRLSWDFPRFAVLCLLAEQMYSAILNTNVLSNFKH